MKAKFSVAFAAAAMVAACVAEGDAWFPFVISYAGANNASSVAHMLDAPAGKYGFVRVEGGDFVTGKGPIRFNGTNITGPANFPEHDVADRLAARFARLGINCVRLHFMDTWYKNFMDSPRQGILDDDTKTQRKLSPQQLDKLDYMIAAFKKRRSTSATACPPARRGRTRPWVSSCRAWWSCRRSTRATCSRT